MYQQPKDLSCVASEICLYFIKYKFYINFIDKIIQVDHGRELQVDHAGADLGGGSRRSGPPLSYMKNDVMHTAIYAALCMLPSLDLQDCTSF